MSSDLKSVNMISPFLASVATLLPFFRYLAAWLDVVLVALAIFSGDYGKCVLGLNAVALVFNLLVNLIRHKQAKRMAARNGQIGNSQTYLPQSIIIAILDGMVGVGNLTLFIMAMVNLAAFSPGYFYSTYNQGYVWWTGTWTGSRASPTLPWTLVGNLTAVHFHFFFTVVAAVLKVKERRGQYPEPRSEPVDVYIPQYFEVPGGVHPQGRSQPHPHPHPQPMTQQEVPAHFEQDVPDYDSVSSVGKPEKSDTVKVRSV